MFDFLKEMFCDQTKTWKNLVQDPLLGELKLNEDSSWWDARTDADGERINFQIGGKYEPDPGLIAHARTILANYGAFLRNVKEGLEREKIKFKGYEKEIDELKIETISFLWPARQNDGIIFFEKVEGRLWRMDYISRKPQGLGFNK